MRLPLGGGDPIDVPQECVSPKIEELDPPGIEVEDVKYEDSNNKEPRGSYVNSEGLRRSYRYRHQPTYPIVTGQPGGYYDEGLIGQYKSFLEEGVINMNPGDAEDYKISGEEVKYHIIGIVLAQKFSLKAGLKNFVKLGDKSSVKELTQIHDMTTFIPLEPKNFTREYLVKALSSLTFLVDKQYGTIKAKTCADGRKKIRDDIYNKHDYASPTCENNSVVIKSAPEAKEGCDTPGMYLHT